MRWLWLLMLIFAVACGAARAPRQPTEIELLILDRTSGLPLLGVAVYASDGYVTKMYLVNGAIRFSDMSVPLIIHAYKPGYAPSYPRRFPPGPGEIRLYRVVRAN